MVFIKASIDVKQEENTQLYNFENADKNVQNEINQSIEKIQHFENQINLLEQQLKTKLINSSQFFINFYGGIKGLSKDQLQKEISNDINSIMHTIEMLKEHDLHSYLFDLAHQLSQDNINSSKNRVENNLSDIEEKLKKLTNKINSIQSKFQTTQERFDQIKSYVFLENNNQTLLFNDLSEREKTEIEKIKNSWKNNLLDFSKRKKNEIDEKNKDCDLYNTEIQKIKGEFSSLNKQKNNLEQELEILEKKINDLRNESQQYTYIPNQSTSARTDKEAILRLLSGKIRRLEDTVERLVGQKSKLKSEIENLESNKKMNEKFITNCENFKKRLEERYENEKKGYQDNILYELNSLYEIISSVEE